MRKIRVSATTTLPPSQVWEMVSDIKNWPDYVEFVKWIKLAGPVHEGTYFDDLTVILWIPVKIRHKIIKIEKERELLLEAYMPYRKGLMYQSVLIKKQGKLTEVVIEIKFEINFLFDLLIGWLVQFRLNQMVVRTLKNIIREKGIEGNIS